MLVLAVVWEPPWLARCSTLDYIQAPTFSGYSWPLTEVFDSAGRLKRAIQLGASFALLGVAAYLLKAK